MSCDPANTVEFTFLLLFAVCMGVFYLVNLHNEHIKEVTWKVLSVTISIFCAIVMFFALNDTIMVMSNQAALVSHRRLATASFFKPGFSDLSTTAPMFSDITGRRRLGVDCSNSSGAIAKFCLMIVLFVVAELGLLFAARRSELQLAAWGLIGAHLVGFAAAEAFGAVQICPPFGDSAGSSFVLVAIAIVFMALMMCLGQTLRLRHVTQDKVMSKIEEHWLLQCEHTEDEFFAFAMGFLISIATRSLILGFAPELHVVPYGRSAGETQILLLLIFVLGFVVAVLGLVSHKWEEVKTHSHIALRALEIMELTLSMSMGWLLLWWGKWQFWLLSDDKGVDGHGTVLPAEMYCVAGFTVFTYSAIFILDFIATRSPLMIEGMRALTEAFLLMLGLSWEGVFMNVMEGSVKALESPSSRVLASSGLGLAMCVIVMPAWVMYILPHSIQHDAHAGHGAHKEHHDEDDHDSVDEDLNGAGNGHNRAKNGKGDRINKPGSDETQKKIRLDVDQDEESPRRSPRDPQTRKGETEKHQKVNDQTPIRALPQVSNSSLASTNIQLAPPARPYGKRIDRE